MVSNLNNEEIDLLRLNEITEIRKSGARIYAYPNSEH